MSGPPADSAAAGRAAQGGGKPVVALESTIITHGMPYPANLETALAVEEVVRQGGAVPATVAVIEGRVRRCRCLVLPLPSWLRHCLCLVCFHCLGG